MPYLNNRVRINKIDIIQKSLLITEHWHPAIIAELNGQEVKLVKFKGAFVWHKHDNEDELFYVLKGAFEMHFRDKTIQLKENEMLVVPKGVEHRPVAEEEVVVMLFEPSTTINTGEKQNEYTKKQLKKI